jgi:hypothetical protein
MEDAENRTPAGGSSEGQAPPGLAGDEEFARPAAKSRTADNRQAGGVAEPGGGVGAGQALGQVGARRLVSAACRGLRTQEVLPAGPGGLQRVLSQNDEQPFATRTLSRLTCATLRRAVLLLPPHAGPSRSLRQTGAPACPAPLGGGDPEEAIMQHETAQHPGLG